MPVHPVIVTVRGGTGTKTPVPVNPVNVIERGATGANVPAPVNAPNVIVRDHGLAARFTATPPLNGASVVVVDPAARFPVAVPVDAVVGLIDAKSTC